MMKKSLSILLVIGGALFLTALVSSRSRDVIIALTFGWIGFMGRVSSRLEIRWDGVALFAAALLGFSGMLHLFLRWLSAAMRGDSNPPVHPWRVRSTAAIVVLIVVMFWAGVSMIGVAHQTIWLASAPDPLFGTALAHFSSSDSNLKMIGLGLHNYHDTYQDFPADRADSLRPRHSWVTKSLPYMLYMSDIDMSRDWDDPVNAQHFRSVLPDFINPDFRTAPVVDEEGFGLNHYAGNSRVLERRQPMNLGDIVDGSSETLLVGEVNAGFVHWGRPDNCRDPALGINKDRKGFGGPPNRRGALFTMADGSVRLIRGDIDPELLKALSTPDGGEARAK